MGREQVFARLEELGIPYEVIEHPAVFTIEEMQQLGVTRKGTVCKNLFLRDAKGKRHFLVVLPGEKRADLGRIAELLGSSRLSFASAERLQNYLGLHQGEVTPMGVLNDTGAQVEVAFDRELIGNPRLGVHPNDNTSTVWLKARDLTALLQEHGTAVDIVELD